MMDKITTVFLDVDNTLIDFNKSATKAMKDTFSHFSLPFSDDYVPVFFNVNDRLWEAVERNELTMTELHATRWKTIFEETHTDFNGVAFEQEFISQLSFSAIEVEGARDLLEYLSKKYTLCVASNTSLALRQNKRLESLDFLKYFTHRFYSSEIGASKPSPEFFTSALNTLGNIPKDEIVFIGDSLSADIKGAEHFGIASIWFNINSIEPTSITPKITVTSLSEIKNFL